MRARGMSWGRLPLFVWAILTYSVLIIFAMPVIAAAVTMLLTDRHFGTHFFDPTEGGSPLLWQNLFWFFGHPEVYIMVLPGFGLVSEILPVFARKPIFGYKAIAASTVAIAFLGFLTWAHHMFTAPIPEAILVFVMLSSFLIAVPTGVKMLNWIATLWRGTIEFKTPLLFCAGFIALFLIGGISGVFLAVFPVDWQLNETYFVVAHIHFVLMGGAVFTIFAAIYYWFPKMTGRMLSESLGKLSFYLMFFGFLITFLIQHVMGLDGMPRRVYEYDNVGHLALYNVISTVGSFILGAGVLVTIVNVARSLKVGVVAGPDPWKANTLEWFTTSPPPANNFDVIPLVRSAEPMKDIRREVERRSAGGTVEGPTMASPFPPGPRRWGSDGRAAPDRRGTGARASAFGSRGVRARPGSAHAPAAERLRRADQAEGPIAAAADDDRHDVRGRRSLAAAGRADLPGRLAVGGRRRRREPLVRPRHRRAHGAHGDTSGSLRAHLPARRAGLRLDARRPVAAGAVADREPAGRRPVVRRLPRLRVRLHRLAEAAHAPEHRDRRGRRRRAPRSSAGPPSRARSAAPR